MISRRLLLALAASLALHLAVLVAPAWQQRVPAPRPPPLRAELTRPPAAEGAAEALLKNTLDETRPATAEPPAPRAAAARPRPPARSAVTLEAVQRKLSEHLFYPPEAVAQGLEGEVRLLLVLDAEGSVVSAEVAAGSGHPLLDEAAVRAAFAMGRLPGTGARELILPVVFRLR